jgi:hypothetical protein
VFITDQNERPAGSESNLSDTLKEHEAENGFLSQSDYD